MNKKILISLSVIAAVAAIVVGGTIAYFSDTETSTGNTFTAGSIDLKIDLDRDGSHIWDLKDLVAGTDKFFNYTDVKPGDDGELTVSAHVYNNSAWGCFYINPQTDIDNTCVEPELTPVDTDCTTLCETPGCATTNGELDDNLIFRIWLDQGMIPGFQNIDANGDPIDTDPSEPGIQPPDPSEGDNIWQDTYEPILITPGPIDAIGETWNLWEGLMMAYAFNGEVEYPGVVADGRMVGSITYYFGVGWQLPTTVGNDVQSDTFVGDMTLQVVQYRNNIAVPGPGPINW